jgi:hypothetical protein
MKVGNIITSKGEIGVVLREKDNSVTFMHGGERRIKEIYGVYDINECFWSISKENIFVNIVLSDGYYGYPEYLFIEEKK